MDKMAKDQTCAKLMDRFSSGEEDSSSQGVGNIKISQEDKDQTCGKPDRAFAKGLTREVEDERLTG